MNKKTRNDGSAVLSAAGQECGCRRFLLLAGGVSVRSAGLQGRGGVPVICPLLNVH